MLVVWVLTRLYDVPMSSRFYDVEPTLENYWRGVILFGRNVASHKFALAKALLELADSKADFIPLEKLAEPFSHHIVQHVMGGCRLIHSTPFRIFSMELFRPVERTTKDPCHDWTPSIQIP